MNVSTWLPIFRADRYDHHTDSLPCYHNAHPKTSNVLAIITHTFIKKIFSGLYQGHIHISERFHGGKGGGDKNTNAS
jgi:hypothetical protein